MELKWVFFGLGFLSGVTNSRRLQPRDIVGRAGSGMTACADNFFVSKAYPGGRE